MATVRTTARLNVPRGWDIDKDELRFYHAQVARDALREAQRDGFPRDKRGYVTQVDGRSGHGSEARVRFGGRITYLAYDSETDWVPAAIEVIKKIMRQVPYRSKPPAAQRGAAFRRRHYVDSFVLLRNNSIVVRPGSNFAARAIDYIQRFAARMQPGEVLSVSNIQPYARRVDKGAPGHTPWSSQAPRGVLGRAYKDTRRAKKTKSIFLDYEMRPLPGQIADSEVAGQGATSTYAERRRKRGQWTYSGRIVRKHRVYPVLSFGPPFQGQGSATSRQEVPWTRRPGVYQTLARGGLLSGTIPSATGRAAPVGGTRVDVRTR